jgi:sugar lactone lactonase YvrE
MKRTTLLAALVSLGSLVACAREEAARSDSVAATASTVPVPTEGFKIPESVRFDPALDVYFVSSIDGNPGMKDNNGTISRMDAANPTAPTVLVQGGVNGAELHAPKGLAISGDTLWVTDIDVVRGFDKNTGAPLATVTVAGATFLNDITVGPDGLYITDTGIAFSATGEMSHPGTDRVFAIKGGVASIALENVAGFASPNGIAWDAANDRFVIVGFAGPEIIGWKLGEKTVTTIATGPGGYDGVEILADGRMLVSSWADSSINIIRDGQSTRLAGELEAPADIGVDTKRNVVAVPRFNAGRVDYLAIPPM